MKFILLTISFLAISTAYAQDEKRLNYFGINPGVTVEPYYNSGEFDVNILPIVYQRSFTHRLDLRLTSILNFGVRNANNRISHVGLELGAPVFIQKKEDLKELSKGIFIAPIVSLTRNIEANHTNAGAWVEPGYNFLFEDKFALSVGLQVGGTYFFYDGSANKWGNHFGVKVVFGKWF